MIGGHHAPERPGERALRIEREGGDPRQRLLLLGIEDVKDDADEQRMAGLLPMIAPLQRAFWIDEDVGDVLNVAHLVLAAAGLQERIVPGGARIGRIKQQVMREASPPPGRELPVLALDVVDDGRPRPPEQRRNDEADALARSGRREPHHVLRAIVTEVAAGQRSKKHPAVA
jgi:hypothetical protein